LLGGDYDEEMRQSMRLQ